MTEVWALAAFWFGLALIAGVLAKWLRISSAMAEVVMGTIAQLILGATIGLGVLGSDESWVKFLSGVGVMLLTFLAGAELEPEVLKLKWKEAVSLGSVSFLVPFFLSAAVAHYLLGWGVMPSWLAGVALGGTSVAVVYTEMMQHGLNGTDFGKVLLGACFVTDLGNVIALGLIFSPFTIKTAIFIALTLSGAVALLWLTPRFFSRFGGQPSELETKFLLLFLLALGSLATWADSEAVLPAYAIGMALAGTVGRNHSLIRRLRTVTFGLLTPFFFIRAGYLVSIQAVISAPVAFILLLIGKVAAKSLAVYPVARLYQSPHKEGMYSALLMSSGLTFGAIAALYGLSHGIIDKGQYSVLVGAVIASGIVPTMIASNFFVPHHLLSTAKQAESQKGE
jgi:glutathione-regulated potassium-efflux system ancillary protein KefC